MKDTIETLADLHRAFDAADAVDTLPPVHPGEILRTEFMEPFGLSTGAVARALGLPLLGDLRPEPGLDVSLERGDPPGLRARSRSTSPSESGMAGRRCSWCR